MAKLAPGTPVFFRLKSPRNAIAGYGFYSHFVLLGLQQAWQLFGVGNGDANLESFLTRIGGYRGMDLLSTPSARKDPLGCTILRDCLFWPQERWLPWGREQGWDQNIVQGWRDIPEKTVCRGVLRSVCGARHGMAAKLWGRRNTSRTTGTSWA